MLKNKTIHLILVLGILFFSTPEKGLAQPAAPPTSPDECSAQGGVCSNNDANCYRFNSSSNPYTLIGYCDSAGTSSCCTAKTNVVAGSDYDCTVNKGGNCRDAGPGCGTDLQVGSCSNGRICCKTPVAASTLGNVSGGSTDDYQLLEQIPGSSTTVGNLKNYLEDIYKFAFWAIGIAVVLMLTIGGFMYLTSAGNNSRMESAKTVIFDAILGLILALVAWLFLYVINPDLVNIQLPTSTNATPSGQVTAPATTTPTGGTSQSLAQQILSGGTGITLAGNGDCRKDGSTAVSPRLTITQAANGESVTRCMRGCPGAGFCTQTTSLSESMLRGMIQVAQQYPFTVTSITGGSHSANSAHYSGRALDISTSNKSQWPQIVMAFRNAGASLASCDKSGTLVDSTRCSSADHIHIQW